MPTSDIYTAYPNTVAMPGNPSLWPNCLSVYALCRCGGQTGRPPRLLPLPPAAPLLNLVPLALQHGQLHHGVPWARRQRHRTPAGRLRLHHARVCCGRGGGGSSRQTPRSRPPARRPSPASLTARVSSVPPSSQPNIHRPDNDLPPYSVVAPVYILDADVQNETVDVCGDGVTEAVAPQCLQPNVAAAPICAAMSNNTIYGGAYDMVSRGWRCRHSVTGGGVCALAHAQLPAGHSHPMRTCPALQISAYQQSSMGAINTTCYPADGWGLFADCMSAACIRGGPGGAPTAWDGSPITCFCPIQNGTAGQYQARIGRAGWGSSRVGRGVWRPRLRAAAIKRPPSPPCDASHRPDAAACAGGGPVRRARGGDVRPAATVHAVWQAADQLRQRAAHASRVARGQRHCAMCHSATYLGEVYFHRILISL